MAEARAFLEDAATAATGVFSTSCLSSSSSFLLSLSMSSQTICTLRGLLLTSSSRSKTSSGSTALATGERRRRSFSMTTWTSLKRASSSSELLRFSGAFLSLTTGVFLVFEAIEGLPRPRLGGVFSLGAAATILLATLEEAEVTAAGLALPLAAGAVLRGGLAGATLLRRDAAAAAGV